MPETSDEPWHRLPMHLAPLRGEVPANRVAVPGTGDGQGPRRQHGGAKGSGGRSGERNGMYRHGCRTRQAIEQHRELRALLKAASELLAKLARARGLTPVRFN